MACPFLVTGQTGSDRVLPRDAGRAKTRGGTNRVCGKYLRARPARAGSVLPAAAAGFGRFGFDGVLGAGFGRVPRLGGRFAAATSGRFSGNIVVGARIGMGVHLDLLLFAYIQ